MPDQTLARIRILLVEDDALIALDVADTLEAAGAEVVGPFGTLKSAREAAGTAQVDLAVLDIDLHGEEVFPAASILRERGVPFLFYTGRPDRIALTTVFAGIPVCPKPIDARGLLAAVNDLRPVVA